MNLVVAAKNTVPAHLVDAAKKAQQLIRQRHAEATRRAYAADVEAFSSWCNQQGVAPLPASPEIVCLFLAAQAEAGRAPSTIGRRLAAIRYFHREAGHLNPCDAEVVTATMAGIKRTTGTAQRQVAPATADVLESMLGTCGDGLKDKRDRALLVIGFGGAMRRSELVGLEVKDLEWLDAGLRVKIRRSKADQEGRGQTIPVLDGANFRAKAVLQEWLQAAGITEGLVFRAVAKGGKVREGMTDRAVANIIKDRAKAAGLDPDLFSGHSLRSGFLTSAAGAGASTFKMMEVSRHKQIQTLAGYVRQADQFKQHAGAAFM